MKDTVKKLKNSILNSEMTIIELKNKIMKEEKELQLLLEKEYPLSYFFGQSYQNHRSKWGVFEPDQEKSIMTKLLSDIYNGFSIHDILDGSEINKMLSSNFFCNDKYYALFVEYEYGFDFDFEAQENTPKKDKFIYEYLIIEMNT